MARTERSGHTTTDHDFIRTWVEERGGWPARVAGTESGGDDAGLIRIDFPGYSGEGSLERIEWEEWFEKFDESELAFLHRDMSHGGGDLDRFNKLVRRGDDDNDNESRTSRGRSSGASKSAGGRSGSKSSSRSGGASKRAAGSSKSSSAKSSSSSRSSSSSGTGSRSTASKSSGSKSSGSKSSGSKSSGSKSSGSKSSGGSSRSTGSKSGSTGGGSKTTSRSSSSKSSGSGAAKSSSRSNGSTASKSGGSSRRSVVAAVKETLLGGNGKGEGSEIRELLKHELGDLLFAEKVFLKASRTLAKEAQDPIIKARVEEHVRETEGQIERLNEAFRAIGEKPKAEKCEAALGLQEEHDSFKSEEKPSKLLLSAFDLGSGLRVEHYEIAAYRTAIAVATAMGERECANILKENLKEELAMAAFLEKNSLGVLRNMARA